MSSFAAQEAKSKILSRYLYNKEQKFLQFLIDKIQNIIIENNSW